MSSESSLKDLTPDSEHSGLMGLLPSSARPFALLARLDRPIGWWLLFWPCAFGVALIGDLRSDWPLLLWFLLGSIAMRGAGCVYNDIVDRDLDAQVARTRSRPLPSGAVSLRAAWIWLIMLCLIGLVVLLQLPLLAQGIALASLALVAAYPFMKRITWWPQAWLGMVFSWGALVAGATVSNELSLMALALYGGCIFWVIGYDTIYALQDIEDDALVGIRSSARAMGGSVRFGVLLCYLAAIGLWCTAFWIKRPDPVGLIALLPVSVHLLWQIITLKPVDPADPLTKFRSNRNAGLLMFLACATLGLAG
ncbi:4-hydroxybenzoate octaprenyltransferase [Alterisphingorhabdus coralli]|uniref:4-hydroxybenzoate octaprenyltransferase n=1 Tax=Alterisphingorhabdus coralli TaxID=3071408 RepID=A0AA97F811_9SPHN|nr:4-hydroxybenzoate octaprenyltransferase [Parasphingorhabdus sp. SCSIO 66989]WOE74992.1 4-hydroxybenzoate octaprenyltransferase [Parasphingorhabdus sp. SCSIO 66989]